MPTNALIALKALQLGRAAAASPSRDVALTMLDQAIDWLDRSHEPSAQDRQAFYLATRAEMMRVLGDPLPDRQRLRTVSGAEMDSIYSWYMRLEEATESKSGVRWQGSTSPYSAGAGRATEPESPMVSALGRMYRAMRQIGLYESKLTPSERRFLEKAALSHLLHKHGIPVAA